MQPGSTFKQRQVEHTSTLERTFKSNFQLSHGLTQERVAVQHELQRMKADLDSQKETNKELTEIMKKDKMVSQEMKTFRDDKQVVKGVAFNMTAFSSEKGRLMIEKQRDSRRQRHIESLKQCE